MRILQPFVGVIVGGVFILAFGFAAAAGATIDGETANLVVGIALGGGIGVDAGRVMSKPKV